MCAHSSEWVSLVRGKSPAPTDTTCVLAASLRSAELCSTRARSRSNVPRPLVLGASATQRCLAAASYPRSVVTVQRLSLPPDSMAARPASSLATGTRNGEQDT